MSGTWPVVTAFAAEMENKLAENRHKGDREGWLKDTPEALLERLDEEVTELKEAVRLMKTLPPSEVTKMRVTQEAADVGNFAMMVADVCGGLKVK